MAFLTAVLTALAAKALETVASLLCRPCNDEFQNSIQVLFKPESLDDNLQKLSDMANEIKAMRSSDEINNWVSEADKILQECSSSNHTDDQRCCFSGNARLQCKLQKKINKMIVRGRRIKARANLQPKRVELIPNGVPPIENGTTAERNLKRVMGMLEDDDVWMIGLWGPGGVGKTTLAKALNNRLEKTSSFSMVIYVEITKDVDVKGMQKDIAKRLGQNVEEGMDTGYVAERIRNRLEKEKFLLIVDNVWEHIDLPSIGIPQIQAASKSKIVLTTRLLDVCKKMEAKALQIGYLTGKEAWKLFAKKAGDVVNKEEIRPLAETVCQECGRLPLALIVVGSAMREQTNIHLWRNAINRLQQAIPIDEVESKVYKALMLSYDWLEDDTLRFCFLYCSLYPEGYRIKVSELVECWLAKKVIDEQLYYEDAISEGLGLIEKLTSACLLEKVAWPDYVDGLYKVKMHDVFRDFSRWIAERNRCMIFSGHGISKDPVVKFPEEVNNLEWISFVDNKKIELPQHEKDFPKVTTLLLHGSIEHRVKVPHEFLEGFQKLRVLNMQYVLSSPGSSLCLAELHAFILRQCDPVEEIPCMPKLIILDLSDSRLYKIPRGLRESTHLKVLNLSSVHFLNSVEVDIISNLTSLEVLDMRSSGYRWPTKRKSNSKEATLQDLSELKKLKSVYLDLTDAECSYEDCRWMESLENYYYGCNTPANDGRTGRDIQIWNNYKDAEVGSFVLHAESLCLRRVLDVNEIFLNSNSINQSNSKLKKLKMSDCTFSGKSTGPAANCIALSNLETLELWHHLDMDELSFSQIANALGATFPKLRLIEARYSGRRDGHGPVPPPRKWMKPENFFSSNDPHMELPKLEDIYLSNGENMREVFHHGPTKNHVVAPNLRIMTIFELPNLERLCDYELTEQWLSLEILSVWGCPKLKKLPHMPSIKEIIGGEEWWNNLEWDGPVTKSYMTQFFHVRRSRFDFINKGKR